MVESTEARGQWGSKLGFIMAAAGSAVGLGNIWRFPYLTGENGGGAFVLVYLLCVLLIGIPLLYNEVAIGRLTGKNPVGAMNKEKPKSFWVISGILTIFLCFFVLSYYSVIAGWTIGYIFSSLSGKAMDFGEFAANGSYTIGLMSVFLLMTIGIILGGVKGGIEKASKIMMPILLLLIILLIIRTLTLDGAMAGVKYYLIPDLSKINGKVVLQALGQAFFSMSVGWGLMVTYGSYVPKNQNLVSSGVWIAFIDTLVALLGGLLIFPAVFAFGKDPAGGVALVFQVLPEVFEQMPMGSIVGALFFLLLMVAALTSSISMLEVPVSYLIDEKRWSRKKAAWIIGGFAFLVGIPSALSNGGSELFSAGGMFGERSFFDVMDLVWGTWGVVIVCLMFSLFSGWAISTTRLADELALGAEGFKKPLIGNTSFADIWMFFIKYICPVVIAIMIVFQVTE